ncbi:MAG: amino acid ABC transporter permease [Planctomycetota bacterium]|jgi:polar amino acid transport system permease protein
MRAKELTLRTAITLAVAAFLVVALSLTDYRWTWRDVWNAGTVELMAGGLLYTLLVSLGASVLGLILGVTAGLARLSRRLLPNQLAAIYVEAIRGTPLLVQIFIALYCVGTVTGLDDRTLVGITALGFFAGAYVAEIVRAGIEAVPRGQMEAARSLGMTHGQAMRHVIGPQALKNALPPMAGQFISLIKDSSLLMIIGVGEMVKRADEIHAATYSAFEAYIPLAGLYLVLTFPLSRFTQWLERRVGGAVREHRL